MVAEIINFFFFNHYTKVIASLEEQEGVVRITQMSNRMGIPTNPNTFSFALSLHIIHVKRKSICAQDEKIRGEWVSLSASLF